MKKSNKKSNFTENIIRAIISLILSFSLCMFVQNIMQEGSILKTSICIFSILITSFFYLITSFKDSFLKNVVRYLKFLGMFLGLFLIYSFIENTTVLLIGTVFAMPVLLCISDSDLYGVLKNRYLKMITFEVIFVVLSLVIPFSPIIYSILGFSYLMGIALIKKIPQVNLMSRIYKPAIAMMLVMVVLMQSLVVMALPSSSVNSYNPSFPSLQDKVTELNKNIDSKDRPLREPHNLYNQNEIEGHLVKIEEFSRTYRVGDKKFVTEYSTVPNTFKDRFGNDVVIDNELEREGTFLGFGGYFSNTENYYNIKLPVNISSGTGIEIENAGKWMEIVPLGGDFSKPYAKGNAVLYNDVLDGVDYQYTILNNNVKEDIILNKYVDVNEFEFEIKAKNLKVEESNGIIYLYSDEEDEPVFTIVAPVMTDASGEVSFDVVLTLENRDGKNIAVVTADKEWLKDPQRAYPLRIDPTVNIPSSDITVDAVKSYYTGAVGDNGYTYIGYDMGAENNGMQRTYLEFNYDFSGISNEARINSAYVSMYQGTLRSSASSRFGVYNVSGNWKATGPYSRTWDNQPDTSTHTYISQTRASASMGYLDWEITDQLSLWIAENKTFTRLVFKAVDERYETAECFYTSVTGYAPKLTINWEIPDPVDPTTNLLSVNLNPITYKNNTGLLQFKGVFADGVVRPGETVSYSLSPSGGFGFSGTVTGSASYKTPNSSIFDMLFPSGSTKYVLKNGNWQTAHILLAPAFNTLYKIPASDSLGHNAVSDGFIVYQVKQMDTFPFIANYYGVTLDQIMKDNKPADTLLLENNTIFIRNPLKNADKPYNPSPLTDDQKRKIDSALMGRGLHCEFGFEPINLNTGNFYMSQTDAGIPDFNNFNISRTYNSKGENTNSVFGRKWSFEYSQYISGASDGSLIYTRGDGSSLYFTPDGSGGYISPVGYEYTLKRNVTKVDSEFQYSEYILTDSEKNVYTFNRYGLLQSITDLKGNVISVGYDSSYRINKLSTSSGLQYVIVTDDMGKITSIELPNGRTLRYTYDSAENLISYTDALGNTVRYEYDSQGRMTAWYDQENNRIILNTYDSEGRVLTQEDALGNVSALEYSAGKTITTDANGNVTVYHYDSQYRTTKIEYPDGTVETKEYDTSNNISRVVDKQGVEMKYTYDSKGNILTQTRGDGKIRAFEYNTFNQVTKVTDYDESIGSMEYDVYGLLTRVTKSDGTEESYTYDSKHRMVTRKDANENVTTYEYHDDKNWVSKIIDARGNETEYLYNSMGQLITVIDSLGNMTRIMYDVAGNKIGEQDASGGYQEYIYDRSGNMITYIDAQENISDIEYDFMSNPIEINDPQRNVFKMEYDGNYNKTKETLLGYGKDVSDSKVWEYIYDSMNRISEIVNPDGGSERYTYDEMGNILSFVDPMDGESLYEYDKLLKAIIKRTDTKGNMLEYTLDIFGRVISTKNPDGSETFTQYDSVGRIVKYTNEIGFVNEYTYDANGNIIVIKDILNIGTENEVIREFSYQYDACNNLIKTIDPLGAVISYEYDSRNQISKEINQLEQEKEYTYDVLGRLSEVKNAEGSISTEYDFNGNIVALTDALGNTSSYKYNELDLLSAVKDPQDNISQLKYDESENVVESLDALGNRTEMFYDKAGNILKTIDANGNEYIFEYDLKGNNTLIIFPDGNMYKMEYDSFGLLVKSSEIIKNAETNEEYIGLIREYEYDVMGRVVALEDNAGNMQDFEYDAGGRLIKQTNSLGRKAEYTYDMLDRITQFKEFDGNITKFEYDLMGNVVKTIDQEGRETVFEYDLLGNLLSKTEFDNSKYTYMYDELNRLEKSINPLDAITQYIYDANNNLTQLIDANGNEKSFEYDSLNRLVSYTNSLENTSEYTYDALSRVLSTKTAEENIVEYRYDPVGNLTHIKDSEKIYGKINIIQWEIYQKVFRLEVLKQLLNITIREY